MTRLRFQRIHELSEGDRTELLTKLDASAPREDSRRASVRLDYRITDIPLSIDHPSGGSNRFLVYGRNISRGGLGVLHGGFIHVGSKCCVLLRQVEGPPLAVRGAIRHCRLVAGSWHELGIVFEKEINPRAILGTAMCDEHQTGEAYAGERAESGAILVSDPVEPERLLLADRLTARGYDIVEASTPGGTLDAVQRMQTDLVLLGTTTVGKQELRLIERLRETGFKQPITLLAADTNPAVTLRAIEAGVTNVVSRPYELDTLVAGMRIALGQQSADEPLRSTALIQPGMQTHLTRFVKHVRRLGEQIRKAHAKNETEELRRLCLELKGSGGTFGFAELTVAAAALLGELDREEPELIEDRVERLVSFCNATSSAGEPTARAG
jgi:DNA-binding response OmpR family regulator